LEAAVDGRNPKQPNNQKNDVNNGIYSFFKHLEKITSNSKVAACAFGFLHCQLEIPRFGWQLPVGLSNSPDLRAKIWYLGDLQWFFARVELVTELIGEEFPPMTWGCLFNEKDDFEHVFFFWRNYHTT